MQAGPGAEKVWVASRLLCSVPARYSSRRWPMLRMAEAVVVASMAVGVDFTAAASEGSLGAGFTAAGLGGCAGGRFDARGFSLVGVTTSVGGFAGGCLSGA